MEWISFRYRYLKSHFFYFRRYCVTWTDNYFVLSCTLWCMTLQVVQRAAWTLCSHSIQTKHPLMSHCMSSAVRSLPRHGHVTGPINSSSSTLAASLFLFASIQDFRVQTFSEVKKKLTRPSKRRSICCWSWAKVTVAVAKYCDEYIRRIDKLSTFRRQLKSHLFQSAVPSSYPVPVPQIRFTISGTL